MRTLARTRQPLWRTAVLPRRKLLRQYRHQEITLGSLTLRINARLLSPLGLLQHVERKKPAEERPPEFGDEFRQAEVPDMIAGDLAAVETEFRDKRDKLHKSAQEAAEEEPSRDDKARAETLVLSANEEFMLAQQLKKERLAQQHEEQVHKEAKKRAARQPLGSEEARGEGDGPAAEGVAREASAGEAKAKTKTKKESRSSAKPASRTTAMRKPRVDSREPSTPTSAQPEEPYNFKYKVRTRYLDETATDILEDYPPDPRAVAARKQALLDRKHNKLEGKTTDPSAPSFTNVPGPGNMVLRAAESQMSPRVHKVLVPPPLHEPDGLHATDASLLARNTADLEPLVGQNLGLEADPSGVVDAMPSLFDERLLVGQVVDRATPELEPEEFVYAEPAVPLSKRGGMPDRLALDAAPAPEVPDDDATGDNLDFRSAKLEGGNREGRGKKVVVVKLGKALSDAQTTLTKLDEGSFSKAARGESPLPLAPEAQEKLDEVWTKLKTPVMEKLDFIVKYTTTSAADRLNSAVEAWQMATEAVIAREDALRNMSEFSVRPGSSEGEGTGQSDKTLKLLDNIVHTATSRCKTKLEHLASEFGDHLTYEGARYIDRLSVK
mmetsp:Transcript_2145/g.4910  ORF Transcript_2145/g.4910 Transcript_2145/m.4910 type:complete len:609 (+) Transcript_2145:885-2711(+)